mmetsp:Transcript_54373/g.125268  ORF Transcript_54373/g.125268 Transcript_54373/m.125268 type:complete len:209 (-) Transcript_54373:1137-1763(-)
MHKLAPLPMMPREAGARLHMYHATSKWVQLPVAQTETLAKPRTQPLARPGICPYLFGHHAALGITTRILAKGVEVGMATDERRQRSKGQHHIQPRASQSSRSREPAVSRSVSGGPDSTTLPAAITTTRSQFMIVSSRCAIRSVVTCESALSRVRWIKSSVSRSTDAVASSSTSTREFFSSARHMHTSCLCPIERLAPRSSSWRESPSG